MSEKRTQQLTQSKRVTRSAHRSRNENIQQLKGCLLEKLRSPVPRLEDLVRLPLKVPTKDTDFIRENISYVKHLKSIERPNISQDSCDGHRQNLEKAGLQLKYVYKKEYGRTPGYISKLRQQQKAREESKKLVSSSSSPSSSLRYVAEEEKQLVLNGLKNNLKEASKQLLLLPVIADTLSKQRRKIELENRLAKLERDIEMLERNEIIVIAD